MPYITQTDVAKRWDTISEDIKDVITSEVTSDFIWKVCEEEHIPDQKKGLVSRVAGYVLLGFIHPGDMAQELAETMKVEKRITSPIADSINKRIFDPIKTELDGIYEPLSKIGPAPMPKSIDELRKPPSPPPAPPSAPLGSTPGIKPATDFSKSAPSVPTPLSSMRIPGQGPNSGEAPKILQEEVQFKPLRQQSGFGISISMPKSIDAQPDKEKIPMKPAMLEFGSTPAPQAQKAAEEKAPRVVHYSEFRTPLSTPPQSAPGQAKPAGASIPAQPAIETHERQEITAMPSSAPPAPATYGSVARQMPPAVSMPESVPPPSSFPPKSAPMNLPPTPSIPPNLPRMADPFLNEKELPPPAPRPPINPGRIPPTPPQIPPRPPKPL